MSGLLKPKKYDWKDSNLALFGSDTEKQVKKDSAATEPAWRNAGQKPGLQIWRIVKFKVTNWAPDEYGKFYEGDSYIILHTYKPDPNGDKLAWDVHFWIGKYSTQDEYGTAAYKTVELDTFLDDGPVQHREVQGHESDMFKSYFKSITYLKGGAETGFNKVKPEVYKPRLLHFHGNKKEIIVKERPMRRDGIDSSDVYVLDLGQKIYQWNGKTCNKDEKYKAVQYVAGIKSERGGKPHVETVDEEEEEENNEFFSVLSDCENNKGEDDDDDDDDDVQNDDQDMDQQNLFKLSDESGELQFSHIKVGDVSKRDFKSKDVFILDTGKDCFVWVGQSASDGEKQNGMTYAHNYLMGSSKAFLPVTVIKEGQRVSKFESALAA